MDHFIDTKIPKLGIFVDKNSQNDQTPFPKVGRKTPGLVCRYTYSKAIALTKHDLKEVGVALYVGRLQDLVPNTSSRR